MNAGFTPTEDATPILYHAVSPPDDREVATLCGLEFGRPFTTDGTIHRDAHACAHLITCPVCLLVLRDRK